MERRPSSLAKLRNTPRRTPRRPRRPDENWPPRLQVDPQANELECNFTSDRNPSRRRARDVAGPLAPSRAVAALALAGGAKRRRRRRHLLAPVAIARALAPAAAVVVVAPAVAAVRVLALGPVAAARRVRLAVRAREGRVGRRWAGRRLDQAVGGEARRGRRRTSGQSGGVAGSSGAQSGDALGVELVVHCRARRQVEQAEYRVPEEREGARWGPRVQRQCRVVGGASVRRVSRRRAAGRRFRRREGQRT